MLLIKLKMASWSKTESEDSSEVNHSPKLQGLLSLGNQYEFVCECERGKEREALGGL